MVVRNSVGHHNNHIRLAEKVDVLKRISWCFEAGVTEEDGIKLKTKYELNKLSSNTFYLYFTVLGNKMIRARGVGGLICPFSQKSFPQISSPVFIHLSMYVCTYLEHLVVSSWKMLLQMNHCPRVVKMSFAERREAVLAAFVNFYFKRGLTSWAFVPPCSIDWIICLFVFKQYLYFRSTGDHLL